MHPVIKYVLRDNVPTPISQIYSKFPHTSKASVRAALSNGVKNREIQRLEFGVYGPLTLDHTPKAITLESLQEHIDNQLKSMQYHIAQETIKQIKATLSKLPTSKHDYKDRKYNARMAQFYGMAQTLKTVEHSLLQENYDTVYKVLIENLPEEQQKELLVAFCEHTNVRTHKDPDPKILAEVQAWMESLAT